MSEDIMSKHTRDSICPGCATYVKVGRIIRDTINAPQCVINPYHKRRTCPCSKCLIKMICEETCDKLEDYRDWCGDSNEYERVSS